MKNVAPLPEPSGSAEMVLVSQRLDPKSADCKQAAISTGDIASGKMAEDTDSDEESQSWENGNPRDNTESYMGPPPSDLWETLGVINVPAGTAIPGLEPQMEDWKERVKNARVVIVSGFDNETTQWAAEKLACDWKLWNDVRRTSRGELTLRSFAEHIKTLLLPKTPRCLVFAHWGHWQQHELVCHIHRLNDAARDYKHKEFGLVLWTHDTVVEYLVKQEKLPENVPCLRLPNYVKSAPSAATDRLCYEGLFGFNADTPQAVVDAGQTLIERTLARILVLFGDLPEGDVDELLVALLGDTEISIKSQKSGENPTILKAVTLWRTSRVSFLRKAGLLCFSNHSPPKIGFATPDLRFKAEQAAWQDTQAMVEVFASVRDIAVLFSDESENVRRALFKGYVYAAAKLAIRAPRLYGATWLDSISKEYVAWIAHRAPNVDLSKDHDLISILGAIRNADKRNVLWGRFIKRMADLCRFLTLEKASAKMVESFLDSLAQRDLYHVLWRLILELRESDLDFPKWIRRLIHDSPDIRFHILSFLAREAILDAQDAQHLTSLVANWLPATLDEAPKNAIEEAALQFPAILLDEWHDALFDPAPKNVRNREWVKTKMLRMTRLLQLEISEDSATASRFKTVRDYWLLCFQHSGFDAAVRKWRRDSADSTGFALAMCLYQAVELSQPQGHKDIYDLADVVRRYDEKCWQSSRVYWRAMALFFQKRKRGLRLIDENDAARDQLDQRIDICQDLNQL